MDLNEGMLRNAVMAWQYVVNEKRKGVDPAGERRDVVTADDASLALCLAVVAIMRAQERGALDEMDAGEIQAVLFVVREFIKPWPKSLDASGQDPTTSMLRDMVQGLRLDQLDIEVRQSMRGRHEGDAGTAGSGPDSP